MDGFRGRTYSRGGSSNLVVSSCSSFISFQRNDNIYECIIWEIFALGRGRYRCFRSSTLLAKTGHARSYASPPRLLSTTMAPPQTRMIYQTFLDKNSPPLHLETLLESKLTDEHIDKFLKSAPAFPNPIRVGITPAYNEKDQLLAIAIATEANILVIQLQNKGTPSKGRNLLLTKVLCNPDCVLYTFNIAQLALSLYLDHGLRILNGVNIESICPQSQAGVVSPLDAVKFAVGDRWPIHEDNLKAAFQEKLWEPAKHTSLALKAWLASCLPAIPDQEERFNSVQRVNTKDKSDSVSARWKDQRTID